jgi:hypothetical protein
VATVAATLLALGGCGTDDPATGTTGPLTATRTATVDPFTPDGQPKPGLTITNEFDADCRPSALDGGNSRARQCFTGGPTLMLDPCFVPGDGPQRTALCLRGPDSHRATLLTITDDTAPPATAGTEAGNPWYIELADGSRCRAAGPNPVTLDGMPLSYGCGDDGFLYGLPDRSRPVWTIHHGSDGSQHTRVVRIRTAWH